MSKQRDYQDYLNDILEAIAKIQSFIEDMTFDTFQHDDKTIFAVIRGLEIIGEATKRISPTIRGKAPRIPWREMAGMRDKLAHDYLSVDVVVVWRTISEDLPALKLLLNQLLDDNENTLVEE